MSSIPSNLKYVDSHEWVRVESDGTVTVGISDHAQSALGDLVFVEVPEAGKSLEVLASNTALNGAPELVNSDPYGEGWLFKLKPTNSGELSELLDAKAYEKVVAEAH